MEIILVVLLPFIIWGDIKLFKLYYGIIFTDSDDFNNSLKYSLRPDLFSLFKGEYFKDRYAEMKLGLLILLCAGTIFLEVTIANAIL